VGVPGHGFCGLGEVAGAMIACLTSEMARKVFSHPLFDRLTAEERARCEMTAVEDGIAIGDFVETMFDGVNNDEMHECYCPLSLTALAIMLRDLGQEDDRAFEALRDMPHSTVCDVFAGEDAVDAVSDHLGAWMDAFDRAFWWPRSPGISEVRHWVRPVIPAGWEDAEWPE
jgi:hypothetical protein